MDPKNFAAELRRIADKIDNSRSPSRFLVAADLRRAVEKLSSFGFPQIESPRGP